MIGLSFGWLGWRGLWGPITMAIATGTLTLIGLLADSPRDYLWIIVLCAGFIVVNTFVYAIRDQTIVRRLGRHYDKIQRRSVQIISDLGELTRYDLWMVDLYLLKIRLRRQRTRPYILLETVLSRQLSISLVDTRPQPTSVRTDSGPHGMCFREKRPLTWFDPAIGGKPDSSLWESFNTRENGKLALEYGVLDISPLSDQLGRNCIGVLAIHVAPSRDRALHALGVLQTQKGRRRIMNACVEIHGLLTG